MNTPSKVFTVIVEPKEGERGLTQRKIGMYECPKCGMKFPTIVSRQKYLIVAEEQFKKIQGDLQTMKAANQDLESKVGELVKEQKELEKSFKRKEEEAEVKQLNTKLEALERQVSYLRKEKGELEEKVTKFRR
jgi:Skp family chaperone for outer membrane proteins